MPRRPIRRVLRSARKALALARRLRQGAFFRQLAELRIESSGLSADGTPFVKLEDGPCFYGYRPTGTQLALHRLFASRRTKARVPSEAAGVAFDIVQRYLGPPSREAALAQGKYFDLSPGETVIEVGAYTGFYAMRAAELVGDTGRVVAMEAIAENADLIRRNIEANSLTNLTLVAEAAWRSPGTLTFHRRSRQLASAVRGVVDPSERHNVPCSTVDDVARRLGLERVDLVRIQVNGAESEVLAGMPKILSMDPKLMIAAPYPEGGTPGWVPIEAALHERGYSTRRVEGNVFAWPG